MVSATGNIMTALGILVKNNFSCHFTLNNQEQSSVIQIPLLELIPNQQRKAVIKVWKRRKIQNFCLKKTDYNVSHNSSAEQETCPYEIGEVWFSLNQATLVIIKGRILKNNIKN